MSYMADEPKAGDAVQVRFAVGQCNLMQHFEL